MNQTQFTCFTPALLLSVGAFAQNAPTVDGRKPGAAFILMNNSNDGEVDSYGSSIFHGLLARACIAF